jgi:hypothetical protein
MPVVAKKRSQKGDRTTTATEWREIFAPQSRPTLAELVLCLSLSAYRVWPLGWARLDAGMPKTLTGASNG